MEKNRKSDHKYLNFKFYHFSQVLKIFSVSPFGYIHSVEKDVQVIT